MKNEVLELLERVDLACKLHNARVDGMDEMVAYCDILKKPLDVSPRFKEDGREGGRVGYYCPSCGVTFPIRTSRLKWDNSGVASDGCCPCGGHVVGVYRIR